MRQKEVMFAKNLQKENSFGRKIIEVTRKGRNTKTMEPVHSSIGSQNTCPVCSDLWGHKKGKTAKLIGMMR